MQPDKNALSQVAVTAYAAKKQPKGIFLIVLIRQEAGSHFGNMFIKNYVSLSIL